MKFLQQRSDPFTYFYSVLTLTSTLRLSSSLFYYLFIEKHLRANNPRGFLQYHCVNFLEDTNDVFPQRLPTKGTFEVHTNAHCKPHRSTSTWIRSMQYTEGWIPAVARSQGTLNFLELESLRDNSSQVGLLQPIWTFSFVLLSE